MVKLLRIYILNTLTALTNLERSTTSLKIFIALSSHFIYGIKLFITKNLFFTSINGLIISIYIDDIKIINSKATVNSLK